MNISRELMKLAKDLDSSAWMPGGIEVPSSDVKSTRNKNNGKSNIRDLVNSKYGKSISENKAKNDRKVLRSRLGREKVVRELLFLARDLLR